MRIRRRLGHILAVGTDKVPFKSRRWKILDWLWRRVEDPRVLHVLSKLVVIELRKK